jgi:hypothetical protein
VRRAQVLRVLFHAVAAKHPCGCVYGTGWLSVYLEMLLASHLLCSLEDCRITLQRRLKNIQEAPKPPLSAYIRFTMAKRPEIKQQQNLSPMETMKLLGRMWKEAPAVEVSWLGAASSASATAFVVPEWARRARLPEAKV